MARLIISSPDGKKGIVEITKPVLTIGRGHANDLVLNDFSVSRLHAVIKQLPDGNALLADRGSTNGIILNGERLQSEIELKNGDLALVGLYELTFERVEESALVVSAATIPSTVNQVLKGEVRQTIKSGPPLVSLADFADRVHKLERDNYLLTVLYDAGRALNSRASVAQIAEQVMSLAFRIHGAERGFMMLFNEAGEVERQTEVLFRKPRAVVSPWTKANVLAFDVQEPYLSDLHESDAAESTPVEGKFGEALGAHSKAGPVDPGTREPAANASRPQGIEPRALDSKPPEPKAIEPKAIEPKIILSRLILERMKREKQPILIADRSIDDRFSGSESMVVAGLQSAMCTPLVGKNDRLLGILYVDNLEKAGAFTQDELNVLSLVAAQAAAALDNIAAHVRLAEQSVQRSALERFLSPDVVDMIAANPEGVRLGGANTKATMLFADIRGFTTMSEKLQPEKIVEILNEYFTRVTDVIFDNGGTLDKYIGDAVMAVFGAPISRGNDAVAGVKAAVGIQRLLHELNRDSMERNWPELRVGIGINTGVVTAGNIGSPRRLDYTVIGDAVNIASRLMSHAAAGQILISTGTASELGPEFRLRKLRPLIVKGKKESLSVFSLGWRKHATVGRPRRRA